MSLDFRLKYNIDNNEICVYSGNITHNLNEMAEAAGVYGCLWCPLVEVKEEA